MAFKDDTSFLRFVTMGAIAARAALRSLNERHHHVIELERNCCSNKIWRTKIKRMRLPDLLCTRCGRRFEVRAKSNLEIKMSHSPENSARHWDAGMMDDDLVVFVGLPNGDATDDFWLNAFSVGDLRRKQDGAKRGQRKSASEGAELDLTWPSWTAKTGGRVVRVGSVPPRKLVVEYDGGRQYTYNARDSYVLVQPGEIFRAGKRILAASVPATELSNCPGETWRFDFAAATPSQKYTMLKAARFRDTRALQTEIRAAMMDPDDRIALEAAGVLTQTGDADAAALLGERACAGSEEQAPWAMEATFILAEIKSRMAREALKTIATSAPLSEVRAAAYWGLRETPDLLDVVSDGFADAIEEVREHAIMAVAAERLTADATTRLIRMLEGGDLVAAGASEALRWARDVDVAALLTAAVDDNIGAWAFSALAGRDPEIVKATTAWALADAELQKRLETTWFRKSNSWAAPDIVQDRLRSLRSQYL